MAETNTTVTETNKAENGSTGAYGGDPTQAVKVEQISLKRLYLRLSLSRRQKHLPRQSLTQ